MFLKSEKNPQKENKKRKDHPRITKEKQNCSCVYFLGWKDENLHLNYLNLAMNRTDYWSRSFLAKMSYLHALEDLQYKCFREAYFRELEERQKEKDCHCLEK